MVYYSSILCLCGFVRIKHATSVWWARVSASSFPFLSIFLCVLLVFFIFFFLLFVLLIGVLSKPNVQIAMLSKRNEYDNHDVEAARYNGFLLCVFMCYIILVLRQITFLYRRHLDSLARLVCEPSVRARARARSLTFYLCLAATIFAIAAIAIAIATPNIQCIHRVYVHTLVRFSKNFLHFLPNTNSKIVRLKSKIISVFLWQNNLLFTKCRTDKCTWNVLAVCWLQWKRSLSVCVGDVANGFLVCGAHVTQINKWNEI